MKLLVIRHAIAEDKAEFAKTGQTDDLRPLTDDGRKKMRRVAKGLRELVPQLDVLASSPLVRARQTAEIVAKEYGRDIDEFTDVLRPESRFQDGLLWLGQRAAHEAVAIVGHEPHLADFVTWLMSGGEQSRLELKKGGACLLTFEGKPARAGARLEWLSTPAQLRAIG
jgi:phosphohistidine phosphatase